MLGLDRKVAEITGGPRGLGNNSMAEAYEQLHFEFSIDAEFIVLPEGDDIAVQGVTDSVVRNLGLLDVIILSAGVDIVHADECSPEKFCRVVDVSLTVHFSAARAAGKLMIAIGRGGSIIFVGFVSGFIVNWPNLQCAYNLSRRGYPSLEVSKSRTPMPHWPNSGCALWLASHASSCSTGSDTLIDGGYTVV
ncbi:hypothetical protein V1517DRAFT_355379 [Lipomyces orientalis]|uniref:Uncharacterized protein n=1 Tax=Lipomyces orientalis TaxID=1233043 RepID=A0ACC3TDW9_9ASCO